MALYTFSFGYQLVLIRVVRKSTVQLLYSNSRCAQHSISQPSSRRPAYTRIGVPPRHTAFHVLTGRHPQRCRIRHAYVRYGYVPEPSIPESKCIHSAAPVFPSKHASTSRLRVWPNGGFTRRRRRYESWLPQRFADRIQNAPELGGQHGCAATTISRKVSRKKPFPKPN